MALPAPVGVRLPVVANVCAGEQVFGAIASSGEVYTFGTCVDPNPLGHAVPLGHTGSPAPLTPAQLVGYDGGALAVAVGADHGALVNDSGRVYTWGVGSFGQLGHGDCADEGRPVLPVDALADVSVAAVACGWSFTVALADDGSVYTWGAGGSGQLGHADVVRLLTPSRLRALDGVHIMKVACGESHAAAIDNSGLAYVWGSGDYGQLGLGTTQSAKSPSLLFVEDDGSNTYARAKPGTRGYYVPLQDIACGKQHSAAVSVSGDAYTWGSGRTGRLGTGSSQDALVPALVKGLHRSGALCRSVSCGTRHTAVLAADGGVFMWGLVDLGGGLAGKQQWPQPQNVPLPSPDDLAVQVACGGNRTYALLETGDTVVWGLPQSAAVEPATVPLPVSPPLSVPDLREFPFEPRPSGIPVATISLDASPLSPSPRGDADGDPQPRSAPLPHPSPTRSTASMPLSSPRSGLGQVSPPAAPDNVQMLGRELIRVKVEHALATVFHLVSKSHYASVGSAFRWWAGPPRAPLPRPPLSPTSDVGVAATMGRVIRLAAVRIKRAALSQWRVGCERAVLEQQAAAAGFTEAIREREEQLVAARQQVAATRQRIRSERGKAATRIIRLSRMFGRDKLVAVLNARRASNVRMAFFKWQMMSTEHRRRELMRRSRVKLQTTMQQVRAEQERCAAEAAELAEQRLSNLAFLTFLRWKSTRGMAARSDAGQQLAADQQYLLDRLRGVARHLADVQEARDAELGAAMGRGRSVLQQVKDVRQNVAAALGVSTMVPGYSPTALTASPAAPLAALPPVAALDTSTGGATRPLAALEAPPAAAVASPQPAATPPAPTPLPLSLFPATSAGPSSKPANTVWDGLPSFAPPVASNAYLPSAWSSASASIAAFDGAEGSPLATLLAARNTFH